MNPACRVERPKMDESLGWIGWHRLAKDAAKAELRGEVADVEAHHC
jgi:hypothetical protein